MTPDAASELAECLDAACTEAVRSGIAIGFALQPDTVCPLGALGVRGVGMPHPFPPYHQGEFEAVGMSLRVANGVMNGFDGERSTNPYDREAYAVGRWLRERWGAKR